MVSPYDAVNQRAFVCSHGLPQNQLRPYVSCRARKIHRQFYHPTAEKLFNLLMKAKPEEGTTETRRILDELTSRCDPCQGIRTAPNRFRVSFGAEHVQFNERVLMDIMYINGDPILHIVDDRTHFSAAQFLPAVSTDSV